LQLKSHINTRAQPADYVQDLSGLIQVLEGRILDELIFMCSK